jgi:hypothetical protein
MIGLLIIIFTIELDLASSRGAGLGHRGFLAGQS